MKKLILLLLPCFILLFLACGNADAGTWLSNMILGKAQPDECYAGPGIDYPNGIAGYSPTAGPPCPTGSVEKTNQTYLWGLTRQGDSLWFGTGPNVYCTTTALYVGAGDDVVNSSSTVCEYGESQLAREGLLIDINGDVRPPKVFEYDLVTRTLIDRTPDDPLLKQIMGFRSAGSHNGVVFLAGGAASGPAVYMFAFDANTKQYLGSHVFPYGGTIRKWVVVNNKLYTGMGIDGKPGRIFRWYGTKTDVWKFVTVGMVNGVPRELAEYRGTDGKARIAVTASGLWVSPAIELPQGLTQSTAYWKSVWTPQNYDPDYMTSYGYGGGSLYQFDGWLYWGTMHIPGRGAYLHEHCTYPRVCFGQPQSPEESSTLSAGTSRSTSIWRARNVENTNPEIQLLYGEAELPKFNSTTRQFDLTPNLGGYTPLYGTSGFGNRYNSYTWEMQVANGRLFIGTLDLTGTDLWRFDSSNLPAVREDGSGLGDYRNYGIRTMEASADGNTLFCGMASYANLGSDPGWELRELLYAAPTTSLDAPFISPEGGTFTDSVTVSLSANIIGSSIYYTLDGSEPTQTSKPYVSPIVLTGTTTVKARAFLGGYLPSASAAFTFTKAVPLGMPAINPDGGPFTDAVAVSISVPTEGAAIRYTLDGSDPIESSYLYESPFVLTETATVKASAFLAGYLPSNITNATFTKTVPPQLDAPVIDPAGGTFIDSVPVSISVATAGAAIRYTLDGSDPTESSALYESPIVLTDTVTVKAGAFLSGYLPSGIVTVLFTKIPPPLLDAPVIDPAGGTFIDSATVSISGSTAGSSIYYTLDGSDPTESSALYGSPIVLTDTTTVKTRAFLGGYQPSSIAAATFTKTVPPQFDFSLSNDGDKSVVKGSPRDSTISAVLVSGDTQAVTFLISGLPDGATSLFSLDSCSPACTTSLTITTSVATPAGVYGITVTGTAGALVKTTDFYLEVLEQS